MGDKTKIEWADASWNPIRARDTETGDIGWHCVHVSEACRWCYAESMNLRLGTKHEYKPVALRQVQVFMDDRMLLQPLSWKRPRLIFVCSMTDLFADFVTDEMIDQVFAMMALAPQHTYLVLTKRPERMAKYFAGIEEMPDSPEARGALVEGTAQFIYNKLTGENPDLWLAVHLPLPNVWLGTSIEDQPTANVRTHQLRHIPAAHRFISAEPLLGPIVVDLRGIDWLIAGGESGRMARPMHPDWARGLRDQCADFGIPFHFKQWGEFLPVEILRDDWAKPNPMHQGEWIAGAEGQLVTFAANKPTVITMRRVGKKNAGRFLDGVEHNGGPTLG